MEMGLVMFQYTLHEDWHLLERVDFTQELVGIHFVANLKGGQN